MTFGEKLFELRTAAGLTQPALAEKSGMPLPSLRKYEQGKTTRIPFSAVVALAKALGVDCTAFADCEDVTETEAAASAAAPPPAKKSKGKKT